jgi:superfamily II DNA or RNA helicase
MSIELKQKIKKIEPDKDIREEICDITEINKIYSKKCSNNVLQLKTESDNRKFLGDKDNSSNDEYLYPDLNDPSFIVKIAEKKEFSDTKYDGTIHNVKEHAEILSNAEYELLPQQAFVRNFLSFQTPYNSLLLFHGLGSGKTCSAIGVCEEMRDYLKQMGINKKIIIVASPNVQDNFKVQLFDERKLKEVDGIWTMKGCLGNKLLKEINPTGMKGLKKEKIIQQVKTMISSSYSFQGYLQFSNEIVRKSGNESDSIDSKIKRLQNEYSDSLIVIDEVHNIRISDDNENKNVAKNLMFLVSVVSNIRLLLLSATPMFNSYKEIVWLLNLMNMNDRRGIVTVSDIFDKDGNFKKDNNGEPVGRDMLVAKATGYVSYVRGENPYTFPFRVYPNNFAPDNTFISINDYPEFQINGMPIDNDQKIQKLILFVTPIGKYQEYGYNYIIDTLRGREEGSKLTKTGRSRKIAAFSSLKSFGYTDLQLPIEALNIIYPHDGLEEIAQRIKPIKQIIKPIEQNVQQQSEDIAPTYGKPEKEFIQEVGEMRESGPINSMSYIPRKDDLVTKQNEIEIAEANEIEIADANELKIADANEIEMADANEIKSSKKNVLKTKTSKAKPKPIHKDTANAKSFKDSILKKNSVDINTGIHNIEGITESNLNNDLIGGVNDTLFDPKELTGSRGLSRIMEYIDTKTPAVKGQFSYKDGAQRVFQKDEIGKYSAKIKNVCNSIFNESTNVVSDGIILIYSSYIDAGIIPMALALEEMGFTRFGKEGIKSLFKTPPVPIVDVKTMKPPTNKNQTFKPARYAMITGDPRISPNNDFEMKGLTNDSNIYGEDVKVVLISQAGSEGLDFRAIRQIHILEPWYNVNRIEQIIGRGVRNFSHKDLPFDERNVQIFMYGTMLPNAKEEAIDLYIYRMSELKALKIGKVTRLLKQTAVDCIINHGQTNFTNTKLKKEEEENKNVKQILSNHHIIEHFEIGDLDDTPTCDFMKCEFDCLSGIELKDTIKLKDIKSNVDTYNETFMLVNSDKIIQKIKTLMKIRHFYKKRDLLQMINIPKKYPISQIYAALTQIITDNTEYIIDKWGRTGYLINIGDYYLFQPSELNYKNVSIYDRSVPIDYKHDVIKFEIKNNITKPVIDKRNIDDSLLVHEIEQEYISEGKTVLDTMLTNYTLAMETATIQRGNKNWYQHCGIVITKMATEGNIINTPNNTEKERLEVLRLFLIHHIVDTLMSTEKIHLLNYLYSNPNLETGTTNNKMKFLLGEVKKYIYSKFIMAKGITGIVLFNGPSRVENLTIYILENNVWNPAQPQDKKDLMPAIANKYKILNKNVNHYVGFIGFETNKKYMVYKIKDTINTRSTGFRCDQSGKDKTIDILDNIEEDTRFIKTKDGSYELCVRQEFTLRSFEKNKDKHKVNGNVVTWFVDTETAIINEFEKKERH